MKDRSPEVSSTRSDDDDDDGFDEGTDSNSA
jgi:hypothetical protein